MNKSTAKPNLQEALKGVDYPAFAADLIATARRNAAAMETMRLLRSLPASRVYNNVGEVGHVLAKEETK